MKTNLKRFALALILLIFVSWIWMFASSRRTDLNNAALNELVKSEWEKYGSSRPTWEGEVSIYIMTPKGNYFSASNPDKGASSKVHFRAASVTKTFTAASIMLLDQQGKLNINDKITALIPGSTEPYVPNTPAYDIPNKERITIRQLLKHRAGVWDISNNSIPAAAKAPYAGKNYVEYMKELDPAHTFTFDELVGVVASNKLSFFAPDASYHYSDTGYSILGKMIERVSGQRYDQFVKNNLLIPNGLKNTTLPYLGDQQTLPAPFSRGYSTAGKLLMETTMDNMSPHVAEGNVISTAADLAVWIGRLLRGEAGVSKTGAKMMMEGTLDKKYGLGISYVPGLGYGHDGGHAGYATVVKYDPSQDVAVVISASMIVFDDLVPYYNFLHNIGRKAKNLLGYPTAEAG